MHRPALLLAAGAAALLSACTTERPVRVLQADGSEVLISGTPRAPRAPRPEPAAPPQAAAKAAPMVEAPPEPAAEALALAAMPAPGVATMSAPPQQRQARKPLDTRRAPDPARWVGGEATVVQAALGDATLRRREPPAEVWQYRTGACVLDLVLYPDGPGGGLQVAHVAVRPVDATTIDGRTCAAHVLAGTPARD